MKTIDYLGYALDLLESNDRASVEAHLASHPEDSIHLDRVRALIAPLETVRGDDTPPPDLSSRTLARLAAQIGIEEPAIEPSWPRRPRGLASSDQPEARAIGGRFRADAFVAAGIGLVAIGLALSFVNRAWHANQVAACQNNLRSLYLGLSGYADTHHERFPQVGTPAYPTADSFVQALADAGQCPPGFRAMCPAAADPTASISYTYSLGHRTSGNIVQGQWRSNDLGWENGLIPISADYPAAPLAPGGSLASRHGQGQNVLFTDGSVRYATVATVGVNGDNIFLNQRGEVAAGVNRVDTVLGGVGDMP